MEVVEIFFFCFLFDLKTFVDFTLNDDGLVVWYGLICVGVCFTLDLKIDLFQHSTEILSCQNFDADPCFSLPPFSLQLMKISLKFIYQILPITILQRLYSLICY